MDDGSSTIRTETFYLLHGDTAAVVVVVVFVAGRDAICTIGVRYNSHRFFILTFRSADTTINIATTTTTC